MNDSDLHQLLDRTAIIQLAIDYCWAIDGGRWEQLRRIFTPNAVTHLGHSRQDGIEAIILRVSSVLGPLDASQHLIGSHQIELDGDRATGRCYLQAQHVRRDAVGGGLYKVGARYEDGYVNTNRGWRIAERHLVTMWAEGNREVLAPPTADGQGSER